MKELSSPTDPSRRRFIRSTALLPISTALSSDPYIAILEGAFGRSEDPVRYIVTCDILRPGDLLYLRYYFSNAELNGGQLKKKIEDDELFLYIKTPSQHIAEELETEISKVESRASFDSRKKRSFLSGSSWLAFRVNPESLPLQMNEDDLLCWGEHFQLVTIDDFASRTGTARSAYGDTIHHIKQALDLERTNSKAAEKTVLALQAELRRSQDRPTEGGRNKVKEKLSAELRKAKRFDETSFIVNPNAGGPREIWPLTKIEVPFKMYLSPIGKPSSADSTYERVLGEHSFVHNNKLRSELTESAKSSMLVKPWENELVFKDSNNESSPPRFKVTNWDNQSDSDGDNCIELLPAPIHREELHNLTMLPAFDRDVVAEYFKVSSFGASTFLKYSNQDPTVIRRDNTRVEYTTVAWDQQIKLARDNDVSITFRAVDVFTGIKLLVSVIAQRRYLFGVSYLEKRYKVTYAEPDKDYEIPIVINRVPFKKLIPNTKGAFFSPVLAEKTKRSYIVTEEGTESYDCNKVLPFEYIGIDKNNKQHVISLKIIFLPAESYRITEGSYCYPGFSACYTPGSNSLIRITHIGLLDPTLRAGYKGPKNEAIPCGDSGGYKFQIERNFDKTHRPSLQKDDIEPLRKHVAANLSCYQTSVKGDLTFADIDGLKKQNDDGSGPVIDRNSASSTFNTDTLLLFCDVNAREDDVDMFNEDFPLLPRLEEADVIISQIDQIEGQSLFRKVKFADSYFKGKQRMHSNDAENPAALLLQLIARDEKNQGQYVEKPVGNFFAGNYKKAGALVDPGIVISHISVLDQGITYNETHNKPENAFVSNGKITSVKAGSIFGELNAQVLGISLRDIVEEVLPVADLPVFNYLKQADESIKKFKAIARDYQHYYDKWNAEYNTLKDEVAALTTQLANLEGELRKLAKSEARAWLDELLVLYSGHNFFQYQADAVDSILADYHKNLIGPIKNKLGKTFDSAIKDVLMVKAMRIDASGVEVQDEEEPAKMAAAIASLLSKVRDAGMSERNFKESVKIYAINHVIQNKEVAIAGIVSAAAKVGSSSESLLPYYRQLIQALTEAAFFSSKYAAVQAEQVRLRADQALRELEGDIKAIISKVPLFSTANIKSAVAAAQELALVYEHYRQLYQHLELDYYIQLAKELKVEVQDLSGIEQKLIDKIARRIDGLTISSTQATLPAYKEIEGHYNLLKQALIKKVAKVNDTYESILSDYARHIASEIELADGHKIALRKLIGTALDSYNTLVKGIDVAYEEKRKVIEEIRQVLSEKEAKLKDYAREAIGTLEGDLADQKGQLIQLYAQRGSTAYNKIKEKITELNAIISKLKEASHQKLNYRFSTSNFRRASLGGVIEFIPDRTLLEVDVNSDIEFAIDDIARGPRIVRQDYSTLSTLKNFRLNFLKLISIDFERVVFTTGSVSKNDFQIVIRDVQFAGCLSFVQAFQQFLSTLSENLVFEITTSEARIGYSYAIPDFSAGYFNFFNFNINAVLTLPFDPNRSLQLQFGLGSERSKFGLTVSGIFGGQGYFNLIAEPKRGIVGMIMVLEFGAIFHLNLLSVVKGSAYLVGGVFIKRYGPNHEIRAYILCVGRFRILGLFSAGVSFYMGLHGHGSVLEGECAVTVSKRFSRFFKISVTCRMHKTLKGPAKEEQQNTHALHAFAKVAEHSGLNIIDSNLNRPIYYSDQGIFVTFETGNEITDEPYHALLLKEDGTSLIESEVVRVASRAGATPVHMADIDLSEAGESGKLKFQLRKDRQVIFEQLIYLLNIDEESDQPALEIQSFRTAKFLEREISAKEYYRSYFNP